MERITISDKVTANTIAMPVHFADPRRMDIMDFVNADFELKSLVVKIYNGAWLDNERKITSILNEGDYVISDDFRFKIPAQVDFMNFTWRVRLVKETWIEFKDVNEYIRGMKLLERKIFDGAILTFEYINVTHKTSKQNYRLEIKGVDKRKVMLVWAVNGKRIDKIEKTTVGAMIEDFSGIMKDVCHYTPVEIIPPVVCQKYADTLPKKRKRKKKEK
jgi:hypothetical protein